MYDNAHNAWRGIGPLADQCDRGSQLHGATLKVRVSEKQYSVDDETTSIIHKGRRWLRGRNRFELLRDGKSVLSFDFLPSMPLRVAFDPTPFVDEEASDFMLFIPNVLSEPTRRKTIWRT